MSPEDDDRRESHRAVPAPAAAAGLSLRFAREIRRLDGAHDRAHLDAQRSSTAALRDETAVVRDLAAAGRDRDARRRDEAASRRDPAAEAIEGPDATDDAAALRALRSSAVAFRRQAEADRALAAGDRTQSAEDREDAAEDRRRAGLDELTGVFRRGTGALALTHEVQRSRRVGQPMVMAMIDIDSLKVVNDIHGHGAGDELVRDVTAVIVTTLRSYDVTVRWGGDEFACALSNVTLDVARRRVAEIQTLLKDRQPAASISAGLALLAPDETLDALMARAGDRLHEAKRDERARRARTDETGSAS